MRLSELTIGELIGLKLLILDELDQLGTDKSLAAKLAEVTSEIVYRETNDA